MDIFSSHLVKNRKIEMIMYTSVVLFVVKDLSNLKTLENHFQAESHYPERMELKVMFQILDSVFRFRTIYIYTLPCGWDPRLNTECIYFISFTQYFQAALHTIYHVPEIHLRPAAWSGGIFQLCHTDSKKI